MTHLSGWTCSNCADVYSNPDIQPAFCEGCGDDLCASCVDNHACDGDKDGWIIGSRERFLQSLKVPKNEDWIKEVKDAMRARRENSK